MNEFIKSIRHFWPFLKEVFFSNQEVREQAKKPGFLAKTVLNLAGILAIMYYILTTFTGFMDQNRRSYENLTDSYAKLQVKYQNLVDRRSETYNKVVQQRMELEGLYKVKRELLQQIETLKSEKGNSAQEKLSSANQKLIEENKNLIGSNKALRFEIEELRAQVSGLRNEKEELKRRLKTAVDAACVDKDGNGENVKKRIKGLLDGIR